LRLLRAHIHLFPVLAGRGALLTCHRGWREPNDQPKKNYAKSLHRSPCPVLTGGHNIPLGPETGAAKAEAPTVPDHNRFSKNAIASPGLGP
jgi:hypothetical protein